MNEWWLYIIAVRFCTHDFLLLSVTFDSDSATKTPAAIPTEGPTAASKPSKGAKARDVSSPYFFKKKLCFRLAYFVLLLNESLQDNS